MVERESSELVRSIVLGCTYLDVEGLSGLEVDVKVLATHSYLSNIHVK